MLKNKWKRLAFSSPNEVKKTFIVVICEKFRNYFNKMQRLFGFMVNLSSEFTKKMNLFYNIFCTGSLCCFYGNSICSSAYQLSYFRREYLSNILAKKIVWSKGTQTFFFIVTRLFNMDSRTKHKKELQFEKAWYVLLSYTHEWLKKWY